MKTYILSGLSLFVHLITSAQKPVPAFGVVDQSELKLTSCAFEPDANAVKLFDVQEVEYEHSPFGGKIRTEKRVRIKLFNEKGYPHATVTIPYFNNKKNTKVEELKGAVYYTDANGQLVTQTLNEEEFFKVKALDKVGMIRFTFPNLKPGSIVEYSYVITEKNRLQIDNWFIQSDLPSLYSSMSITIPTFSQVKEITYGDEKINEKTEALTKGLDREKKTYFRENIKSFQPEPHMSSFNDNVLKMSFLFFPDQKLTIGSISPSSIWRMGANMILKSTFYNEQAKKNIPGTEKLIDTALSYLNLEDRLRYLYTIVQNRIPEKDGQAVLPEDISDAWKKRTGSSAEINFLLHNLLSRAGITNYPVFVSTREHGKINKEFPSFGQFNGMDLLVDVNGKKYLVDASLKFQSYQTPPINVLNREALILNPDNISWAMITDDRPLIKQTTDIFATLTDKGKMEGGATLNYHDYAKSLKLDSGLSNTDYKKQKFFEKNTPGLKILSDNLVINEGDEPLMQTMEFDYDLQNQGDFYFINPQQFVSGKINPFIRDNRNTDIDFGCNQELRITMQLDIPASFKVEELPNNIVVRSPDSSFVFTRMISVHQSKISFSQKMEIRKAVFSKTEYAGLFDFFKQIQKLVSEEIILKKSS